MVIHNALFELLYIVKLYIYIYIYIYRGQYCVPCQYWVIAWPFIMLNREVCLGELE